MSWVLGPSLHVRTRNTSCREVSYSKVLDIQSTGQSPTLLFPHEGKGTRYPVFTFLITYSLGEGPSVTRSVDYRVLTTCSDEGCWNERGKRYRDDDDRGTRRGPKTRWSDGHEETYIDSVCARGSLPKNNPVNQWGGRPCKNSRTHESRFVECPETRGSLGWLSTDGNWVRVRQTTQVNTGFLVTGRVSSVSCFINDLLIYH